MEDVGIGYCEASFEEGEREIAGELGVAYQRQGGSDSGTWDGRAGRAGRSRARPSEKIQGNKEAEGR